MVMYMSQPSPSRPSARVMMEQVQKKCDGECMVCVGRWAILPMPMNSSTSLPLPATGSARVEQG